MRFVAGTGTVKSSIYVILHMYIYIYTYSSCYIYIVLVHEEFDKQRDARCTYYLQMYTHVSNM